MDLDTAVKGRRSIRKYKQMDVPKDAFERIMDAGNWAPSAGNRQSRRFFVAKQGTRVKEELAECMNRPQAGKDCAYAVVVCADKAIGDKFGERGVELYRILDCGAAVQNMLLTAYAEGLGGLWVGSFDPEKVRGLLELPENLDPVSIVLIGVPDENPEARERNDWKQETVFL